MVRRLGALSVFSRQPLGGRTPRHGKPITGKRNGRDGIRAQLIRRQGEVFLWSRGEELINQAFPDVVQLADQLSDGTVLDGELLVALAVINLKTSGPATPPRPQSPGRSLLKDCPAALISYDLLEAGGNDLRNQPLRQRRQQLEAMAQSWNGNLRLSSTLTIESWDA